MPPRPSQLPRDPAERRTEAVALPAVEPVVAQPDRATAASVLVGAGRTVWNG
jgi:hypothetical protein